jgi:hypothetical protein
VFLAASIMKKLYPTSLDSNNDNDDWGNDQVGADLYDTLVCERALEGLLLQGEILDPLGS